MTADVSRSFNKKNRSRSYSFSVGAGSVDSVATFSVNKWGSSSATIRLQLVAMNGTVVADVTGPSGTKLDATVANGNYQLIVSSAASMNYSVTTTFTAP